MKKFDPQDLTSFVARSLQDLDVQTEYLHNWHIDLICEYLLKVYKGQLKRLIINVPPRSLKSVCINVAFPAWILANKPSEKIISVSYSQALALKHSSDCRKIMNSDWYMSQTKTRINQGENEKKKFVTNENGYRFATSIGGTLTGEGGNFIIVDDPQNPAKIHSKKEQETAATWFDSVLMSRLNNKKIGRIVIVMQRLHPNDLTGYLLSKPNSSWQLLSIPSISDNLNSHAFNGKFIKHRGDGALLQSSREDKNYVLNSVSELGNFTFAAQYQQSPAAANGIINTNWFPEFDQDLAFESIYYSIDTAVSIKGDSDFTAIIKFGVYQNCYYILDIVNKRLDYVSIKNEVLKFANLNKNAIFLIEDKNVGSSLIADLKAQTNVSIIPIIPLKDKVTRLFGVINILESRRVLVKKNASFAKDFLSQISAFPNCLHDDQVDALTQFLNYIKIKQEKPREMRFRLI